MAIASTRYSIPLDHRSPDEPRRTPPNGPPSPTKKPHPVAMSADPDHPSWHRFLKGLRAFVARRVPEQDADDVVQEVLLRLHQGAAGLRDAKRAEAWVFTIARRTIADFYRARRPTSEEEVDQLAASLPDEPGSFATFPGDHSVHEEVLSWLRPMAEELPEKYRQALILADFEGLKQREVATRLGLSLSGAKSRVQRARTMLAGALEACCEVELGPDGRAVDFLRRDCACDC